MIPFLARQWFRVTQGSTLVGLPMNAVLWIAAQYGIYIAFFRDLNIPFWGFMPVALIGWLGLYWGGGGFLGDITGLFAEVQNHMNTENNPQWTDVYGLIKKMAEKMEVK